MTDSGFDSGPPSKKSKSSPSPSITSFDPDTADLGLWLSELSNALPPELSNPISKLQPPDGVRRPEETIQNNQHLSALLGTDVPPPPLQGPMNSDSRFMMSTAGLLAPGGAPTPGLQGPIQQMSSELRFPLNAQGLPVPGTPSSGLPVPHQPGTTVSWPLRQQMNYPQHRYPMASAAGVEVPPQGNMHTPLEFAPGLNNNFAGGQAYGAGFTRGPMNPAVRMAYGMAGRIRMSAGGGPRLVHGGPPVPGGAQPPGVRPGFNGGEKLTDDQIVNGVYPICSGELPMKQFGPRSSGVMSQPYPPMMNTRSGGVTEQNNLAPASDVLRPAMPRAPLRAPQNVTFPEAVPQSSTVPAQMPSDIGATVQPNNTEKQRLIQQQLVLIFHAHKCDRREQANVEQRPSCPLPQCQSMKNVLRHMISCSEGRLCRVPHCSSSRQIISHWRNCSRPDCPICAPLKNGNLRRPMGAPPVVGPSSGAVALTEANPVYEGFSPKHATAVQQPPTNGSDSNVAQMSLASNAVGIGSSCAAGVRTLKSSLVGDEDIAPIPGQDWRVSVTQDLRNHLVHKLVQAIFPTHQSMALKDPRMNNLVRYAKKVEGDMYERARSREDYYHLLAEKIYKIQKELEQKKLRKIFDQNGTKNAGFPMAPGDPSGVSQAGYLLGLPPSPLTAMLGDTSRSMPVHGNLNTVSSNNAFMDAGIGASPALSRPTVGDPFGQELGGTLASTMALSSGAAAVQGRDRSRLAPLLADTSMTNAGQVDEFAQNLLAVRHMDSKLQLASVLSKRRQEMDMMERRQTQSELMSPSSSSSQSVSSFLQSLSGAPVAVGNNGATYSQSWEKSDKLRSSIKQEMAFEPFFSPGSVALSTGLDSVNPSIGSHMNDDLFGYDSLSMPSLSSTEVKVVDIKHEDITDDEMGAKSESAEAHETLEPSYEGFKKEVEVKPDVEKDPSVGFDGQNPVCVKSESDVKMETDTEEKAEKNPDGGEKTSVVELKKEPSENGQVAGAANQDVKPGKKVWTCDEINHALMPIIDKLYFIEPEAAPFRFPVDPVALCIPDYFQIVKKPMDLSTIRSKLESGDYTDPWSAIDDVFLMFDNAWLYNRKTSKVYKFCTKLAEVFESEADPVMQSLGFCCGRRYMFTPQVLCCFGKQLCVIPRDSAYYNYLDRYIYCEKCFNELHGNEIEIHDDPSNPGLKIKKESFVKEKNDKLDPEPMVNCLECGRRMHKICVLHLDQIWSTGFICSSCRQAMEQKRKENKYTARRLPPTKLGAYLENRINSLLKRKAANCGDVTVRVLSSYDKVVEVKPAMKAKFVDNGMMSESFPYRVKSIFAFEEIDGTDVCFFGMHVQEYGSECPPTNARRVYIAYLDSVNFFQPRQYRTTVYHELLIGYMDYVKTLGYQMAHIWACPPSEGDDYIFYCHPPDMKIPKPKRLQEWYRKMLDKAICDNVIFDYKDILKDFKDNNMKNVSELPYFEGDFWPNVLEENIKELNQELEKRQKEEEEAAADTDDGETIDGNSTELQSVAGKKKDQKSGQTKKKNPKTKKLSSRRSKTSLLQGSSDLSERVMLSMEKHKEVFFVIRLQAQQPDSGLPDIKDPDPLMNNELLDGRDPFLTMAREKHLEFSSLRRAKFSTAAMLYELHLQAKDNFIYTCNHCKASVETRYHCSVCEDFDLCVACYRKIQHPHRMTKLGLDLDDGSQVDAKPQNPQEARRLKIQLCVQVLEHSCICRDANCNLASCRSMRKALAIHPKQCLRRPRGACPVCKQLFALCCYHAKSCREKRCLVPFCQNIKTNLEKKQQNERFQQQRLLMRRAAMMNCVDDTAGISESVVPTQSVHPGGGGGGFVEFPGDVRMGKSPAMAGNEVGFHPNAMSYDSSVGGKMLHSNLSQYFAPRPDFLPSPMPFSPEAAYGNMPGSSSGAIGHYGQPEMFVPNRGPAGKLDPPSDGVKSAPMVNPNQMTLEKLMRAPIDKQGLLRMLKGNPRLMAEFIKKVRQQEALKQQQQQQQQSMLPPGAGGGAQPVTMPDGSMRNPMLPLPNQPPPQLPGGMGSAPRRTMMTPNGDHGHLQLHQSPQQAPQVMSPGFDGGYQPGNMPCQQPYPGFMMPNRPPVNPEHVGNHVNRLPFHHSPQQQQHLHPQLINHSLPRQPPHGGPMMNLSGYPLHQDVAAVQGGVPMQQMNDPLLVVCSLPSASPLATSSPRPASNSSSPHHLPPHYVNKVLPHSADLGSIQRTGSIALQQVASASNAMCQDAMSSARHLSFSPNAKTSSEMSNPTMSRPMELTDSLQQYSSQNSSYLHFLDRK